ncbi:hypothetical protein ASC87_28590 [Rhizobacter sp. Root1221]|nr:hypothetical protein ASC87_28590 [Rhizobacter sp. Root1221]
MLKSLKYSESAGQPQEWRLERTEFGRVNLLVGKNSTGKSRAMNTLAGLAHILSGKLSVVYQSGAFEAEFELEHGAYELELHMHAGNVVREVLRVNGALVLERSEEGRGKIWFEQLQEFVSFELDPRQFALPNRRDKLQHPFAVELAEWAAGVTLVPFGSELGKRELALGQVAIIQSAGRLQDRPSLINVYISSFVAYGADYDHAIVRGMRKLGYSISAVHAKQLPSDLFPGLQEAPIGLVIHDDELNLEIPQTHMSQGQYRALALVIHLNAAMFSGSETLCLIDDIGEGLDYERASLLVEIAIELAQQSQFQLVMTSNDRFVMNKVPLQYWAVLERKKHTVRAYTARNSPQAFEDFKFLGLSNFDFFTAGRYH